MTLIVGLIALALFLAYAVWATNTQDALRREAIQAYFPILEAEILRVSMLVSERCPHSVEAHQLILQATRCTIVPVTFGRATIFLMLVRMRYEEGMEYLRQAEAIANSQ